MQLQHAAQTDVGRARDHNEDTFAFEAATDRPEGALFLVCDGAGGLAAGETASDLAVQEIMTQYYATRGDDREAALRQAIVAANREVYVQGHGKMGTTAVAAVFLHDAVIIGNVGDSRAIMVREGKPRQISRDHSFVAEQVAAGVITEEQARVSSYRNIITRALGSRPDVETDIFREPVLVGDRIVLCSDGLHGLVEHDEIAQAVTLVPLTQAVDRLIALANARGGSDNITVIAVEVLALSFAPERTAPINGSTGVEPVAVARAATTPLRTGTPTPIAAAAPIASPAMVSSRTAPVAVPPPLASTPPASKRSFWGWFVVFLALAALIGTLAWFALNPAPAAAPAPTPPFAPIASPVVTATVGTTIEPTLVPTTAPRTPSLP